MHISNPLKTMTLTSVFLSTCIKRSHNSFSFVQWVNIWSYSQSFSYKDAITLCPLSLSLSLSLSFSLSLSLYIYIYIYIYVYIYIYIYICFWLYELRFMKCSLIVEGTLVTNVRLSSSFKVRSEKLLASLPSFAFFLCWIFSQLYSSSRI